MSFQAYLDKVEEITGKTPNEFIAMAKEKNCSDPIKLDTKRADCYQVL